MIGFPLRKTAPEIGREAFQAASAPELHTRGFHATTVANALRIIRAGFTSGAEVVFSPPNNLQLAHSHGQSRALQEGGGSYAIIEAEFLPVRASGLEESPHLIVPPDQVGHISLVDTVVHPVKP